MPERPQPTFDPDAAARAVADHLPEVVTPQIDIQEGVLVESTKIPRKAEPHIDMRDFEKEDEKVREAVAEFERQYRKLPPG